MPIVVLLRKRAAGGRDDPTGASFISFSEWRYICSVAAFVANVGDHLVKLAHDTDMPALGQLSTPSSRNCLAGWGTQMVVSSERMRWTRSARAAGTSSRSRPLLLGDRDRPRRRLCRHPTSV